MAQVVAVIASTHHPFYYRASTAVGEERPPFADEWVAKIERFRETLTRARPDVLVMVGSDHFHQLWLDNMPQFLVGKAPVYDANWYNEEREFGLPRFRLDGHEELSSHILRGGLDSGFDLAFSNELRIDHSITCPIITLRPEADLPIVPIYTNIFAPPLPQPKRFVELGRTIRELVESWPSDQRVAIIGTGHLSLELGGPRQFGPHGPDPEFDQRAVQWIANGDLDGCLREVTPRQPAPARQRHPRLHGLHAHDGRRRARTRRPTTSTPSTCSTRWRPTSPGTRTERRHEQVPARQVPVHRRPRPRPRRALPRGPAPASSRGGRRPRPTASSTSPTARRAPGWPSPTRSARPSSRHDHVALFEMGAHPFLTLTLFIAMFERDHPEPLSYQKGYGAALAHLSLPYPDIAT